MQQQTRLRLDAPDAGKGGGGPAPDPVGDLTKQLADLQAQIKTKQDAITQDQSSFDTAQTTLNRDSAQKKDLETQAAALQKLIDGLKGDGQKVDTQRQASQQDESDLCQWLKQVEQDLDQRMSQDYRNEIDAAVKKVDDQTSQLSRDVNDKQTTLSKAETALANAKQDVTVATGDLSQAQNTLKGLAGQIQSGLNQAKKTAAALKLSYDHGQDTDAYLTAADLLSATNALEAIMDPSYEARLEQAVSDAWGEVQLANQEVANVEKDKTIAAMRAELQAAQKALQDYQTNRRKYINDILTPPADGQPAAAPAK